MAFSRFMKDVLMDEMQSRIRYVGTGHDDGVTFTETSGGSYARQPVLFTNSVEGEIQQIDPAIVPIPAGEVVSWVVYFDAQTTGNFMAHEPVTPQLFANDGTITVSAFTTLDINGVEPYIPVLQGI